MKGPLPMAAALFCAAQLWGALRPKLSGRRREEERTAVFHPLHGRKKRSRSYCSGSAGSFNQRPG